MSEDPTGWRGHRLDAIGDHGVGRVEGVHLDTESRRPEWLSTRLGRFAHHRPVPARDAVEASGRVWVPFTREQISGAPEVDPKEELTRERETELLSHYGIDGDAGRAAEVAKRDAGAVTARPAA